MLDREIAQLQAEVLLGIKAKNAYDSYIKNHIETIVKNIYENIENCLTTDTETLISLKNLLAAVRGLETSVLSDIESGNMAKQQLEENDGNN